MMVAGGLRGIDQFLANPDHDGPALLMIRVPT